MVNKEVLILGGGASGLMCAMVASDNGKKVTILEADVKVGKKILVSGNGRCNFTNANIYNNSYNVNLNSYFSKFDNKKAVEFFNKLGLLSYADNEGRMYPKSNLSSSVLDVIINKLNKNNVEIITQTKVDSVKKQNGGYLVKTNNGEYFANHVVLASGSNSLTNVLDKLKIEYKKFTPSLCALKCSNNVRDLSGVRVSDVEVTLNYNNKTVSEKGEILFKDGGISGICIFNFSAALARENLSTAKLSVNMLPCFSYDELVKFLINRKNNLSHLTAKQFFIGMFHKNLGIELLNRADINLNLSVKNFNNNQINNLAKHIQNFNLNVIGFYDNNQVNCGGVILSEFSDDLESKNNNNFYVCGEACNVDGLCGGYNLQWAWTSGYIVGNSLKNKND